MTIQDVTRLLDAGFSKDEILALVQDPAASTEQETEQSPEEEKPAEQEQNQEQSQEQNQEQNQHADETEKRLSSIEASINSLVKAFQKENLLKDRIQSNDETLEQQTDDIMKSIIRPEHKRKDDK